jgi:hypothetical protein
VGPSQEEVLGNVFFRMVRRQFLPPCAIAQCDCHSALGIFLANDVFVEFTNNLARSQFVEREPFFFSG